MLDNELNTIWSYILFSTAVYGYPTNIVKSNTSGYIVLGNEAIERFSATDGFILQINDSGNLLWRKSFGGISSEYFQDIVLLENNEFLVVGNTESFGAGKSDVWLLKFSTTTDVKPENFPVDDFTLYQNYPNPFNPRTVFSYQLPVSGDVTVKVFDVLGNEIATLVDEYKPAGNYEVQWDASNNTSGVYFYQLKVENFIETKKMILLR